MKINPVTAAGYMTRTKTGKGQRGFRPVQSAEPSLLFYMQSRFHALSNFLLCLLPPRVFHRYLCVANNIGTLEKGEKLTMETIHKKNRVVPGR